MKNVEIIETSAGQTIALPEEFRFSTRMVSIRRTGDAIILEPAKSENWPDGFFEAIRVDDALFVRPEQGSTPGGAGFLIEVAVAQFLLDTNTCIALMRNHPVAVQHLAAVSPGDCAISTITAYELFTGVEKCAQPARERAKVQLLIGTVHESPFEDHSAKRSAAIRALLESQGQSIGPYDVLLAGQALANSQILVTANEKEFKRVPGLILENWQIR